MIIYMLYLNKNIKINYSFEWIKTTLICVIMGVTVYVLHNAISDNMFNNIVGLIVLLLLDLLIGVTVYFLCGVAIKQKVIMYIFHHIKEKIK